MTAKHRGDSDLWMLCKCGIAGEVLSCSHELSCLHHLVPKQAESTSGWISQLVKNPLLDSGGLQAWEHRRAGFAKSGGKARGKDFSNV